MAVGQFKLGRTVRRNVPEIAGGAVGVGGPIALRETMDHQGPLVTGQGAIVDRLTRPSVAYGLGAGTLTGLLWYLDIGPNVAQDFFLSHTITGIGTGIFSAALPVDAGGDGGTATVTPSSSRSSPARSPASDFDPAGGESPDAQPAQ